MGMMDEDGDISRVAYGLDNHAAVADQPSIFQSLGDAATYGVALSGLAAVNSFANTGVDIANWFGAGLDRVSIEDEVGDGEMNDYYKAHSSGIEATGFVAGSLIPGTAAIKALKLLRAGAPTNALVRATNIFNGIKASAIESATSEIEAGEGALFGSLNSAKFKAIAAGFGEQAIQALVFETATAATMKASPLLDQMGLSDVLENMAFGTLVGGGIGGVLEGIGTRALINKAIFNADAATKSSEAAGYLGKGGYLAGDRVVSVLDALDQIPAESDLNLLGRTKASTTRDTAILRMKKMLIGGEEGQGIIASGDNEVADKLVTTLLKMKEDGNLSKEDMYGHLSGLSKATRVAESTSVPDAEAFYINQFTKGEIKAGQVGWDDMVTNVPRYNFAADLSTVTKPTEIGTSRAYKLKESSTAPIIARSGDTLNVPGGAEEFPLYSTTKEAYDAGVDLYVDGRGQIHINPDAPNLQQVPRAGESRILSTKEDKYYRATGSLPEGSKPLYGAPVVIDTATGSIKENAVSVVGDFGNVKFLDKGLTYGDHFSAQDISSVPDAATSTLDANARYVWWDKRGLVSGDTIEANDIAGLEQFYREGSTNAKGWTDFIGRMQRRGISIDDGIFPSSAEDALNKIRDAKNDLISDLRQADPKMGTDEIAIRANVNESYLENMGTAQKPGDFMVDPQQSAELRNIKLWYDVSRTNIQDGQITRGLIDTQYRISVIQDALKTASTKFFTKIGQDASQFLIEGSASEASIKGVGSSFLGFSSAGYNSLGQRFERVGRILSGAYEKQVGKIADAFSSPANALRASDTAAAEMNMFRSVQLRTGKDYMFLPAELAKSAGLAEADGSSNIVVLKDLIQRDNKNNIVGWDKKLTPEGFQSGHDFDPDTAVASGDGLYTFYRMSPDTGDFLRAHQQLNADIVTHRNSFYAAAGINKVLPTDTLYAPPINTSNFKHFAYVKMREGMGMGESDATVITAETAGDLEQKIAALQATEKYSIYTKDQLKDYHEIQGDYEYSRNFAKSQVSSNLARDGILNTALPPTRAENIIKDYIDWHSRQQMQLLRDYTELGNGQMFAELKAMGQPFQAAESSRFGYLPSAFNRSIDNPYNSYVKTALAISPKETYRTWSQANEVVESFFDTAFRTAKQAFISASKGIISFDEASQMASKFGLGNPYGSGIDGLKVYTDVANKLPPERYLSKFVAAANTILGASVIKLDTFQQMIHIASTPILTLAEASSAQKYLATTLPDGSGRQFPAVAKVLYQAINNYFDKDIQSTWLATYKSQRLISDPDVINAHFQLMENLTLPFGRWSENGMTTAIANATKIAQKFSGTNFSEQFTSWMAAETGRLIFQEAGYTGQQLLDNIASFANRVRGNLTASQRPVAFQGPLGQAIGLFQTYQFNMMQNLFRYVENGEGKTLAILAGMQTSLFGMSSLPGFQAINTHIVGNAAGNTGHQDLYSATANGVGKDLGDWLLYGSTSNWPKMFGADGGVGLFSRGDMNPRNLTLLPINPLNYPAVAGGIRFASNLLDTASKIASGGSIPSSILTGLEHNGLSRPLGGLAQLVQGYATTAKGSLISQTRNPLGDDVQGWSELATAANFGRLGGARPLDEAVTLDALYRRTQYLAKDSARLEQLGEAAKSTMLGGGQPDESQVQDFASQYAKAGGHIQQFGRKMVEWSQEANASVANKIFHSLSSPVNQNMMTIMGGQQLPDFRNNGSTSAPPVKGATKAPDGNYYVNDPNKFGAYLRVDQ